MGFWDGNGISWKICKQSICTSLHTDNHTDTQFFTGRMLFLTPNQQCQSTEGTDLSECGRYHKQCYAVLDSCYNLYGCLLYCCFSLLLCRRSCWPLPGSAFLGLSICNPHLLGSQIASEASTCDIRIPLSLHACMLDICCVSPQSCLHDQY